ncbi:MAG: glycosyltransferase family 2 protein [Planctomycetaceae bacterium]|jgi:glycosyltransferase involved in cell wall biosynthesis|nr:glycosyltransferase family 2 protein [Planctomycetaceae bacterium]
MPKVSIIIPVYNVEKYLHACLDSVVNQTLKDIEIICVDDGSPDRCPQILDEYAAKDNRITVIHQQNAGLSAARNAAYPFIKGEYTLFVDSDDTIEPDLCEKAVAIADAEQADTTYFSFDRGKQHTKDRKYSRNVNKLKGLIEKQNLVENDYTILLRYCMVWLRLWRSRFLLDNNIQCPVGQYVEDIYMTWQTIIHKPKMALLPEVMYHWRFNLLSITAEPSKKYILGIPATYDLIKEMLLKTGNYHGTLKTAFLHEKLRLLCWAYNQLPAYRQIEYLRMVKERIGPDEQEYLFQKNSLKRRIKVFYFALLGSRFAAVENEIRIAIRKVETTFRKFRDQWKRAG